MDRTTLEGQALLNVCACLYYDLADNLEQATDDDLQAIADDAQAGHLIMGEKRSECSEYVEQYKLDIRKEVPSE